MSNIQNLVLSVAKRGADVQVKRLGTLMQNMDTANSLRLKVIGDPGAIKAATSLFNYSVGENGDMSRLPQFLIALDRLLINMGAVPQMPDSEDEESEPQKKPEDVQPRTEKEEALVEDDESWRA